MTRLGVVAVGDSIINGGTYREVIHPQSWAQWLAEAGDWPFTRYSKGGANSTAVVEEQLPRIVRDGYDVGAVTVGANDLLYGWDAERFAANLDTILARLAEVAERVVVTNLPTDFRRLAGAVPAINAAVPEANGIVERVAGERGALVVDISDLTNTTWLHADKVHPTALGLREIGRRAADVLNVPFEISDAHRPGPVIRARYAGRRLGQSARVSAKRLLGRD